MPHTIIIYICVKCPISRRKKHFKLFYFYFFTTRKSVNRKIKIKAHVVVEKLAMTPLKLKIVRCVCFITWIPLLFLIDFSSYKIYYILYTYIYIYSWIRGGGRIQNSYNCSICIYIYIVLGVFLVLESKQVQRRAYTCHVCRKTLSAAASTLSRWNRRNSI